RESGGSVNTDSTDPPLSRASPLPHLNCVDSERWRKATIRDALQIIPSADLAGVQGLYSANPLAKTVQS
ncbi:hypothetical protein, partial [Pseudomonas brenneri]|uniref:hypothetical protein n=1 Tax=Pseudomonas brenneri TaxID=129817 RepID=UPI003BA2755F